MTAGDGEVASDASGPPRWCGTHRVIRGRGVPSHARGVRGHAALRLSGAANFLSSAVIVRLHARRHLARAVRPGSPTALRFTAAQACLVAAAAVLECSRDCALLARFAPTGLPSMYLAITGLVLLTALLQSRVGGFASRRLPLLLAGAGVVTLALWRMRGGVGLIASLSVFGALFSALLFVQLSLRADACGWSDRPKTFSLLAAGGPIGALLGAGTARLVLLVGTPQALLPLSAGFSFASAALVAWLPGRPSCATGTPSSGTSVSAPVDELRSVGRALARDRRVRPLLAMAMLTAMAGALADFLFKQRLVSELPFDRIPPLLASARMGQALLALALQMAATRWLLRTSGVVRGLVLLPAGLFLVSQGMSVGGELAICLLARVLEGGLRRSLEVGSAEAMLRRDGGARRIFRKALEPATQRLGQTAAMGVIVTTGAAGVAPIWLVGALALASVGWLEWRRAHSLDLPSRSAALGATLVPGGLFPGLSASGRKIAA
jgi:hypothetical protein